MGSKRNIRIYKKQKRLLRPLNLSNDAPGNGFGIYESNWRTKLVY